MGDWNYLVNPSCIEDDLASSGTANEDTSVPGHASANTKSAWVELAASLAFSISGITLECRSNNAAYGVFDIGIGAGGSEVVVVPDFHLSFGLDRRTRRSIYIPLSLPKGTRVALRTQSSAGGGTAFSFKLRFHASGFPGIGHVTRWLGWGTNVANTRHTDVTAHASANTKGSWVQLVAASEFTTKWFAVGMSIASTPRDFSTDIGIGAGGSEVVLIPSISFAGEDLGQLLGPFPMSIPKGTRISARTQCETGGSVLQVGCWGGA